MRKYLVVQYFGSGLKQSVVGGFESRQEAVNFACLCKKSEPHIHFGVYCLDARVEIK